MDCFFLQYFQGKSDCLELARPRHERLCRYFKIRYLTPTFCASRLPAQWHKLFALLDLCASSPDGALIVWGDHDILWEDLVDLRTVPLGSALFGGVKNPWGDFNTGIMYLVNCVEIRTLLARVCAHGPTSGDGLFEQTPVNIELRRMKIPAVSLPRRWNEYRDAGGLSDGKPTVFRAWHNEDKNYAAGKMRCAIRKLQALPECLGCDGKACLDGK